MSRILDLLQLSPAPASVDFVENRKQFHLHGLPTEQRHPKTWNLSFATEIDAGAGLRMLLSVDHDISERIQRLMEEPELLDQAANAISRAVLERHRIYIYGCGATGRLAKQVESTFWRPFWRKAKRLPLWSKLQSVVGDRIEDALVGEMTGADRALVSSLEGFEDLPLLGELQLKDHGITRGDVVICVTEGGETSSVIGTILAALRAYEPLDQDSLQEARTHLYFLCNNPVEVLAPLNRSAAVLNQPAITHINLTTGPQAITGSTRMQATTIGTYVVGIILEEALDRILRRCLSNNERSKLGFDARTGTAERLVDFETARRQVESSILKIVDFTTIEINTYRNHRFATYFAGESLVPVFIDTAERSPTFGLPPFDRVTDQDRRCWVQLWTEAPDLRSAWRRFLGRPFRGLDPNLYRKPFESQVTDPYLRDAALRSLENAGDDQEFSYDFSFSRPNIADRGPEPGDLGVLVLLAEEAVQLGSPDSGVRAFLELFRRHDANLVILTVSDGRHDDKLSSVIPTALTARDVWLPLKLDFTADPLMLRSQVALKMLLNAHSTAVMAAMGRVIGNTMTGVSPTNLKLIGRATYLILSHVNDILARPEWEAHYGCAPRLTFSEANAVLIDAMNFVRAHKEGQMSEVSLAIVRIVEAEKRKRAVSWFEAETILKNCGLASYLVRHNPVLGFFRTS